MSVDPRSWSTSHAPSCTFLPALAALVTSLGPRLDGRLAGELKAQLGKMDICYSFSSFLEALENGRHRHCPSSNHNKPDTQSDELMGETIPLTPGGIGRSTCGSECETSFRGKTQSTRLEDV